MACLGQFLSYTQTRYGQGRSPHFRQAAKSQSCQRYSYKRTIRRKLWQHRVERILTLPRRPPPSRSMSYFPAQPPSISQYSTTLFAPSRSTTVPHHITTSPCDPRYPACYIKCTVCSSLLPSHQLGHTIQTGKLVQSHISSQTRGDK